MPTPIGAASQVPAEIMLLPAGVVTTQDGRGPYKNTDPAKVIAASLSAEIERLPIDENHATDLAAPQGGPSPARGWIVALESRSGAIWGRVEWTPEGRALLASRAYRYISPVITHAMDGTIRRILRAALVNAPNFRSLVALNAEDARPAELLTNEERRVVRLLGLSTDAYLCAKAARR